MAERMRPTLGQSVVIENVGGAGGSIGVGRVARAAPDGYTFDIGQWDTHVGSIIYKLDYDLEKDFEPIALISNNPQLLVAKNDLPANTLAELVTWMKANPGKINFVNQNAAANVTGVLFENLTRQKVQFIPYRGAGPAMTDLISGTVDLLVVQGAVALPQIRAGKIKALANLSPARSASMPDIPTADETGVPGLYMSGWFGFWAPKGTPKDIIAKLNAATVEALADPAIQKRFYRTGPRRRPARAADPGRPGRVPESRDRQMVADHQVGRHRRAGAVKPGGRSFDMDMAGKTVLITGSTDGVGRYVATQACRRRRKGPDPWPRRSAGARRCRMKSSGRAAVNAAFYQADLSSLAEARKLADAVLADHNRLDVFVSNAGIGSQNEGPQRQISADGYELRFAVNYLAGFLLAHLLLPLLKASAPSRIVNVASLGQHPIDFDDVMITQGLQRQPRLCAEQAVADHVHHRSRRRAEGHQASP